MKEHLEGGVSRAPQPELHIVDQQRKRYKHLSIYTSTATAEDETRRDAYDENRYGKWAKLAGLWSQRGKKIRMIMKKVNPDYLGLGSARLKLAVMINDDDNGEDGCVG